MLTNKVASQFFFVVKCCIEFVKSLLALVCCLAHGGLDVQSGESQTDRSLEEIKTFLKGKISALKSRGVLSIRTLADLEEEIWRQDEHDSTFLRMLAEFPALRDTISIGSNPSTHHSFIIFQI